MMQAKMIALFFALLLTASALPAQPTPDGRPLPTIAGQRLNDKKDITLQQLASGGPYLALIAFSRKGGEQIRPLTLRIRSEFAPETLQIFHVPVIARIPGLFRGMARGSLKKEIPEERHGDVVLVVDDKIEDEMRAFLNVGPEDSVHAVGVDSQGAIIATVVFQPGEDRFDALRPLLKELARS